MLYIKLKIQFPTQFLNVLYNQNLYVKMFDIFIKIVDHLLFFFLIKIRSTFSRKSRF